MKKVVAIVLLGAHLMMLGGYALLVDYFIKRSDIEIVKNMYTAKAGSSKLMELKIPVHMPTIQDWTEYAHVVGQIQLKDGYYNYVGIKMTRDTMSLLCLPNHVKDKLVTAHLIIAKDINGNVPINKKGAEPLSKKVSSGYDNVYQLVKCDYNPTVSAIKSAYNSVIQNTLNPYIASPGKPPNFSC